MGCQLHHTHTCLGQWHDGDGDGDGDLVMVVVMVMICYAVLS